MPAYSSTPLVQKLGIKSGYLVGLLGAPADFRSLLGGLPERVVLRTDLRAAGPYDVFVLFVGDRGRLVDRLPAVKRRLAPAGGLWVAWPKKASGVPTDLTENVVRSAGLEAGLVDNKICSVDETWSGLRFVYRLRDRS